MVAGFTLPLYMLSGVLSTAAVLLMLPEPLSKPIKLLCRNSCRSQVGHTVLTTVTAFLVLILIQPVWDLSRMQIYNQESAIDNVERRSSQAAAQLLAYMTAGCILLLYVVRKLGLVEMENDQLRASQQALLRQVNQMQSHYEGKETSGKLADAAESPDDLKAQLKAANAAKEKAERDASALKEQSSSMNREYDRLLAEHDMAQRKLARLEPGQAPSSRKDD